MAGNFDRKLRLPRIHFGVLLHAIWDKRLYFPSEGRRAEDLFVLWKIRRLRPGLNPRTWVPKASTLPLDHRNRFNLLLSPSCVVCVLIPVRSFQIFLQPEKWPFFFLNARFEAVSEIHRFFNALNVWRTKKPSFLMTKIDVIKLLS